MQSTKGKNPAANIPKGEEIRRIKRRTRSQRQHHQQEQDKRK